MKETKLVVTPTMVKLPFIYSGIATGDLTYIEDVEPKNGDKIYQMSFRFAEALSKLGKDVDKEEAKRLKNRGPNFTRPKRKRIKR